jgi:hypothetical protein
MTTALRLDELGIKGILRLSDYIAGLLIIPGSSIYMRFY